MNIKRVGLLILLIVSGIVPLLLAQAGGPSSGCLSIDGTTDTSSVNYTLVLVGHDFNAGETIMVTTTILAGAPGSFDIDDLVNGGGIGPKTMPGSLSYTIPASASYGLRFIFTPDAGGTTYSFTIRCVNAQGQSASQFLETLCPNDGRLNRWHCEFAPIAVYPGLEIYAVNPATSEGSLVLRVSDEQIAAVGVPGGQNTLVAEGVNPFTGKPIALYRLTTGEFQINTSYADGKPYIIVWSPDAPDHLYELAW